MVFQVSAPINPGVPPIVQTPGFNGAVQAITQDLVTTGFGEPVWGIYLNGASVVTAESVVGLDYRNESAISDFPIERGSFESFDKVAVPFSARVRFASGGSAANREALLNSIAAIASDLKLYDVVTPEVIYSNANIVHFDYRRSNENGRGLIVVDVWLEEIRQTSPSALSNTAAPSGADPVDGGSVQPIDPGTIGSSGLTAFSSTSTGFTGGTASYLGQGTTSPAFSGAFATQPLT